MLKFDLIAGNDYDAHHAIVKNIANDIDQIIDLEINDIFLKGPCDYSLADCSVISFDNLNILILYFYPLGKTSLRNHFKIKNELVQIIKKNLDKYAHDSIIIQARYDNKIFDIHDSIVINEEFDKKLLISTINGREIDLNE